MNRTDATAIDHRIRLRIWRAKQRGTDPVLTPDPLPPGNPPRTRDQLIDAIFANITLDSSPAGCWSWKGKRDKHGCRTCHREAERSRQQRDAAKAARLLHMQVQGLDATMAEFTELNR